ncbi:MAG TPA: type II toxin-antitoxin system prevent-host-death family antitoxin [Gemmatimonadales bacterium]|jgi:prevent-host-death family protein|nr:type II toxin-antitoxin system prevent-host-death family antitoxin [Gemmatimonadales bacterium]
MRAESISSAKNRLSALVKEVQGGESVLITDHGVPVAQLVPVRLGRGVPARVLSLAHKGLAKLPERAPSAKWLELPWPELGPGPSPVDLLLAERREGR